MKIEMARSFAICGYVLDGETVVLTGGPKKRLLEEPAAKVLLRLLELLYPGEATTHPREVEVIPADQPVTGVGVPILNTLALQERPITAAAVTVITSLVAATVSSRISQLKKQGLVQANGGKPWRYSITELGLSKIGLPKPAGQAALNLVANNGAG